MRGLTDELAVENRSNVVAMQSAASWPRLSGKEENQGGRAAYPGGAAAIAPSQVHLFSPPGGGREELHACGSRCLLTATAYSLSS